MASPRPLPPASSPGQRWLNPPLPVVLLACATILALRKPDQMLNPQFWAEDGYFYFTFQVSHWKTLLEGYAGYLHTLPRLIAGTSTWWPAAWAPAWFVGCALVTTLAICARAAAPRSGLPGGPWIALAIVLVPDGFEVLLNVANLQWLVAGALMLLLVSADARTRGEQAHDLLTALLGGLTGPFSVLLAPLFVVRAYLRQSRASWLLAGLMVVAGATQLGFILQTSNPADPRPVLVGDGIGAIGTRLAGSLLAGGSVNASSPLALRWALALVTFAVLALAWRSRPERSPAERRLLILAFALLLAASLYRCRGVLTDLQNAGYGSRYFFPLQLILIWLAAESIRARSPLERSAALAALALGLAVNVPRLREPALHDYQWAAYAERIDAGVAVTVPINPEGWTITLPARPGGRR